MPSNAFSGKSPLASQVFDWSKLAVERTPVGERRPLFDSPTQTFANLECHATTLDARQVSHEPHRHPDEELVFVKEGVLDVMINGHHRLATAGSVVFFASNDFHGLKNGAEERVTYYVLRIAVG